MKSISLLSVVAALAARQVAGHAIFQQLWVDGVDMGSQCARVPQSNTPVTNVASNDFRCNVGGLRGVAGKCAVKAGGVMTVEMHQQPGDRSCGQEAIGGAHYGPVSVYLTKVPDAAKADGSTGWFKIFEDGWTKAGSGSGDNDMWGTKDLNTCCGKMDVPVPTDLEDGDYLLRAEALALHTANSQGGAQFYMTCYQISITGGSGTAKPDLVKLPGAMKASDPGILVNIHAALPTYVIPGPQVYPGGTTKKAGSACTGCEKTCAAGSGATGKALAAEPAAAAAPAGPAAGALGGGGGACAAARFAQCGGQGFNGCTTCADGLRCQQVGGPYYSQCV